MKQYSHMLCSRRVQHCFKQIIFSITIVSIFMLLWPTYLNPGLKALMFENSCKGRLISCGYIQDDTLLYFKEHFPFVQEIQKKPHQAQGAHALKEGMPLFFQYLIHSTKKEFRCIPEVDKPGGEIYGEAIHANHLEEKRPFPISLYVYNPVK